MFCSLCKRLPFGTLFSLAPRRVSLGLPYGRPALSAARTGPIVPAHFGDDQEQLGVERDSLNDALCPALRAPEGATFLS